MSLEMALQSDNARSIYQIDTTDQGRSEPPAPPPTPLSASEMLLDPRLHTRSSDLPPSPTSTAGGGSFVYTHGHSDSPMSPAGSWASTDDMAVTTIEPPAFDTQLDLTPDFFSLYDDHDPIDRYSRFPEDVTTGIVGLIFYKSIIGSHGPISSLDLTRVLKYRNRGYAAWDTVTEKVVETAFFKLSTEDGRWNDSFMRWQNLFDRDCTGNSSEEFKQVKARLLEDLESAEALLKSGTIDEAEAEAVEGDVEDEEYLNGEDFEIIEEDHVGEDTDWMVVAP